MLKLALKPGDFITIGEDICVRLGEKTNCNAQLIIEAPREYDIKRHKRDERETRIYLVSGK